MTKENEILIKLTLLMLEIKATYTATAQEDKILKKLFKEFNALIEEHYKVEK